MLKKVVVVSVAGLLATVIGTGVAAAATTADSGPVSVNCRAANGGWAAMADTPAVPAALRRGSGNGGGKGSGNGNGNRNRNRNGGGGYGKRDGSCSTDGSGAMLRKGNGNGSGKGSGNGNGNGKRQRNRNGSGGNCTR